MTTYSVLIFTHVLAAVFMFSAWGVEAVVMTVKPASTAGSGAILTAAAGVGVVSVVMARRKRLPDIVVYGGETGG
jgi:uncharacterized membrane protein YjjB (DUF3815 family)